MAGLTEMSAEINEVHYIVIGVGINANMTQIPQELMQTATSLELVLGRSVNRAQLLAVLMQEFEDLYERFEETGSLKDMMEAYNRVCVNQDRPVRVLDPKGEYTGIARGIDEHGVLLVETEEGSLSRVSSGEVSVRGIYGYV